MSDFSRFMKGNKKKKENGKYAATTSLCDENGNPLEWEFRPISSKENAQIQDEVIVDVDMGGGRYQPKLNSAEYIHKLIVKSVVYPDLYNSKLQDSYGVTTPDDLLYALVDDPGEYNDLAIFVQKFQGFQTNKQRLETAKKS